MTLATTTGVLLRGAVTEDAQGNEVEDDSAAAIIGKPFPISILERDGTVFDEASNQWRTIRKLIGRPLVNPGFDEGDRIRDLRDGATYAVDEVRTTSRGIGGRSSVTLSLRRTTP